MFTPITLEQSRALPFWRRPVTLLFLMAIAMPVAFNTWSALLNNFVIEIASFDGADIGVLHTLREIPGFLAFLVIFLIIFIREQVLGLLSLALLGAATAVTAWFPTLQGILVITVLSSIGFHYFETVAQSLQLQWLSKERAPQMLGWLVATGSAATLVVYGVIVVLWEPLNLSYNAVYMAAGGFTVLVALFWAIWVRWRRFRRARVDPVLEDVGHGFESVGDGFARRRSGFRRWLDSWRSK